MLERGVISFLKAADATDQALATDLDLIGAVSHPPPDLDGLPWYGGAPEPLPVEADADDCRFAAVALTQALSLAGCGRPAFHSRVITAREFNGVIATGLNKADLLVEVVAGLLASVCKGNGARGETVPGTVCRDGPKGASHKRFLAPFPPPEGCFAQTVPGTVSRDASNLPTFSVLVDRLGGRKDYSGLLAKAFPGSEVRELSLSPTESRYRVGASCHVTFACRAESRCMTVALSSMVSKYVRELMMRRLNRYFAERMPALKPTAGYPVDAARFLEDTRDLRRREGVRDNLFIRAR